jgi:DNA mismatch endonuclease (patch repair protein)
MADIVDQKTRSRMMSGIGGKDTKPELILRSALHSRGYRYRLHDQKLPGRPDIVMPGRNIAIFVHGCFWHRHENCRYATTPSTRPEFWTQKFERNVARDAEVVTILLGMGWRVAIVWECGLRPAAFANSLNLLLKWIENSDAGDACFMVPSKGQRLAD